MAENSKIQWTDHTFNPWRGCTKVSDGCKNCYADTMSKRNPSVLGVWGKNGTRVVASEAMWKEPLKWNAKAAAEGVRRRVFCASLADVFEGIETIPTGSWNEIAEARRRLFLDVIQNTPNLDWLLLTKRPENVMPLLWKALDPDHPANDHNACGDPHGLSIASLAELYPNVWIGTTVENQEQADRRIPELLKIPASVRFLSMEPLLGDVDISEYTGAPLAENFQNPLINWVIVGGESGGHARPFNIQWARRIIAQCRPYVSVFVKQLGSNPNTHGEALLQDHKGGDINEWPLDLRVRELPEVAHA